MITDRADGYKLRLLRALIEILQIDPKYKRELLYSFAKIEHEIHFKEGYLQKLLEQLITRSHIYEESYRQNLLKYLREHEQLDTRDLEEILIYLIVLSGPYLGGRDRRKLLTRLPSIDDPEFDNIENKSLEIHDPITNLDRKVQDSYTRLQNQYNGLKTELHTYLSFAFQGIDIQNVPLHRFISVRVYLPEGGLNEVELINKALNAIFSMLDLSISDDFPAETGSWWKRLFVKTNDVATQPEIAERLQKIERALELKGLDEPQSLIDKNKAEAVSMVLSSLEKVPSAVIQLGSLVIIKSADSQRDPSILVKTLSQQEIVYLEKNQNVLRSPQDLFNKLVEAKKDFTSE